MSDICQPNFRAFPPATLHNYPIYVTDATAIQAAVIGPYFFNLPYVAVEIFLIKKKKNLTLNIY